MKKNKKTAAKLIVTGVIGGAVALGGNAVYDHFNTDTTTTTATSTTSNTGSTKVAKVSYSVSSDTTKAIAKVSDAVVSVINYQKASSSDSLDDYFGDISGDDSSSSSDDSSSETEAGEGSGVIYKKDGDTAYVVTNNHVVDGASSLDIMLANGDKVKGTLVGKDAYSDLAVIKISAKKVTKVATFGDSAKLTVGEPAIAIGSPLGSEYANSATEGIISSTSRKVIMQNDSNETINVNAIQTDAAINPGNSGGALINVEGQVIGINSSKITTTGSSSSDVSVEGMGFAIPSNDVVEIINKLEKDGKIIRPALGVQMVDLTNLNSTYLEKLKLPDSVTSGVVIASVQSKFPAEVAGLKKYDVITKIGSTKVTTSTELQSALYKYNVGDSMKVTYYRDGKEKTTTVKLTQTSDKLSFSDTETEDSSK
ncbi:S1C family serine protease [Lactococcus insecticola]|uniref:Serine protease Do-like HtrA n=1 Tax=Pseudolactococcus insecticola TaxID=2709158 RepID=A0A6A0B9M8_9LACT|nr:trypsin-like peptidase domain-containing protein [Lactococcus insecticola]GFH41323.1 serine protease Do-like HtrA [Lactococcus insecticola]